MIRKASVSSRQAAKQYFEDIKNKLENGQNVPILEWFDSSSAVNIDPILNDKYLKTQFGANFGPGIHFSTVAKSLYEIGEDGIVFGYSPGILDETGLTGEYFDSEKYASQGIEYAPTWVRCYDENDQTKVCKIPISNASIIGAGDSDAISTRLTRQGINVTDVTHEIIGMYKKCLGTGEC